MKIRKIIKTDLKTLVKLDAEIFGDTTNEQGLMVFQHSFKNRIADACLVAEEDSEVLGAVMAEKKIDWLPNSACVFQGFPWTHVKARPAS